MGEAVSLLIEQIQCQRSQILEIGGNWVASEAVQLDAELKVQSFTESELALGVKQSS